MFVQTKSNPINHFNRLTSTTSKKADAEKKVEAESTTDTFTAAAPNQPKKRGALFSKDELPCTATASWFGNIHEGFSSKGDYASISHSFAALSLMATPVAAPIAIVADIVSVPVFAAKVGFRLVTGDRVE